MSHPYIVHDENGDCLLKTPYNEEFVRKFKDLVDQDSRKWDTSAKRWWFDGGYERLVRGLVDRHFGKQHRPNSSPNPSPRGASGIILEHKVYPATGAQPEAPELTIESLTAEVSRLTYELETERQRRQAAEEQAKRIVHSAEVLNDELYRQRARATTFEREVERLKSGMRSSTSTSAPISDAYRVLGVTADLPLDVIRLVFGALAKKHHPDVGGDHEKMKQLNEAWAEIQKRRS